MHLQERNSVSHAAWRNRSPNFGPTNEVVMVDKLTAQNVQLAV